jgi:hypothetical protein
VAFDGSDAVLVVGVAVSAGFTSPRIAFERIDELDLKTAPIEAPPFSPALAGERGDQRRQLHHATGHDPCPVTREPPHGEEV